MSTSIISKIKHTLLTPGQSEHGNPNKLKKGRFKNHTVAGSAENIRMPASSETAKSGGDSRMDMSTLNIALAVQKLAGPPAAPPPPPIMTQPDTWAQIKRNIGAKQKGEKEKHKKILDNDHIMEELRNRLLERREETKKTEIVLVTEPRESESRPEEPVRVAPKQIEAVPFGPGMIPPPPPLPAVLSGKKVKNNVGKPELAPKPGLERSKLPTPPQFHMTQDVVETVRLKRTGRSLWNRSVIQKT
ncbi:hypothetical protein [Endozoicomonas sp. YOMI1]|uniref:hypothetical protein n=1 Tax=Endozoicomonas sp. YOMI1 TaxID=2828739 RepID=UPI002148E0AA|nr:hypothetical protein [Endozoicomonas sp. YOMI1]